MIVDSASSVRTGLSCCLVGPSIVEARILTSGGILALCFSISFNTSSRVRVANGAQCRVKRVLCCLTSNVRSNIKKSNVRSNVRSHVKKSHISRD